MCQTSESHVTNIQSYTTSFSIFPATLELRYTERSMRIKERQVEASIDAFVLLSMKCMSSGMQRAIQTSPITTVSMFNCNNIVTLFGTERYAQCCTKFCMICLRYLGLFINHKYVQYDTVKTIILHYRLKPLKLLIKTMHNSYPVPLIAHD